MTNKQLQYKKMLIMQVHRTKLWFDVYSHDRELYEDMLFNNFKVRTSKDLSIDSLKKLVKFLGGSSFVSLKTTITDNQAKFLLTLWKQKARLKDEANLLKLIYNRFKISLNSIYDLEKKDFKKVIAVLQNMKEAVLEAGTIEYSKTRLKLSKG